tara:strand:- start:211 stop:537 length:327 start_codon:yes stop_codon:yes gene_type:complete
MGKLLTFYFDEKEIRGMIEKHLCDEINRPDWAKHLRKNECSLEINKAGEMVVSISGEFEEQGIQKIKGVVEDFVPKRVKDTLEDVGSLADDIRHVAKSALKRDKKKGI